MTSTSTSNGHQPLIVAERMTAGYELERERKLLTALVDINLTVDEGEFMVLVGPSGCGKTTFINVIAGLSAEKVRTVLTKQAQALGGADNVRFRVVVQDGKARIRASRG